MLHNEQYSSQIWQLNSCSRGTPMASLSNYQKHHKYMRKVVTLDDHPKVKGYDFNKKFNKKDFLNSYVHTGFQATHLGHAIHIVNSMIDDKATIMLSMTGNAISSGVREIITWLVKNKKIHVIVTSAAGIEEDIIKCLKPFVIGDFELDGKTLLDSGVGRIGNILVPFDRYLYFEKFFDPFMEELYTKQKKLKQPLTGLQFTKEIGLKINNKESFLYWAAKNNIPVVCPAPQDGSIGELFYFFKQKHKDFTLDLMADNKFISD